jgi:3-(3-hydroxy-phenyl)propionate hydroxylase
VELGVEMRGDRAGCANGVTLQIDGAADGSPRTVRAKYVIACDGGSSTVRTQLDMPLEDLDFDEPWLVVDVLVNERGLAKLPKVSVQYCEPERPCTLVIGPEEPQALGDLAEAGEDPKQARRRSDLEAAVALAHAGRRRAVAPGQLPLPRAGGRDWRKGRVFLAGDAAHMQPPFLGQGMCQGVRDVANLSLEAGRGAARARCKARGRGAAR